MFSKNKCTSGARIFPL